MKSSELIVKLAKAKIRHIRYNGKFIVYADDKPDSMTWAFFQFRLKEIARFNQDGKCICGKKLCCASELHHALITRKTVQGAKCKNDIHCSLNVIELCKECHPSVTRLESAKFLRQMFGAKYITDWYNSVDDKMVSDLPRIEYYLDDNV
jgi:hypothetical protein